jgi:hypothetical protein
VIILGWAGGYPAQDHLAPAATPGGLDLLSATGYSYPSGHMVSAVATSIAIGAVFAVTRQRLRNRLLWGMGAGTMVILIAINRWLTGAHFVSDVVGGALLGGLVATLALVVAGVQVPVPHELVTELVRIKAPAPARQTTPQKRCAVIFNPAKVTGGTSAPRRVRRRPWMAVALWLETTEQDPRR